MIWVSVYDSKLNREAVGAVVEAYWTSAQPIMLSTASDASPCPANAHDMAYSLQLNWNV